MKGKKKKFRSQSGRPESGRRKMRNQDRELRDTIDAQERDFADSRSRGDTRSRTNDPMWYAQNAQLLVDFASYPFGVPIGNALNFGWSNIDSGSIPGIMTLKFQPTVGFATSQNDPITIAARNIYSYVRHANSGHSNYDSPDLMLYIVAMDSVYTMHAWMKRLLGVSLTSSPYNRYYQRAVLRAMGADPDDLLSHLADFRGFVNQYAVKMGSMCIPNSMSYMARHSWMCEGLYVDSSATKAQTYLFTPYSLNRFKLDSQGAGSLEPVVLRGTDTEAMKVSDIMQYANDLLNPIVSNEDMNIMSGDILKAFGPEGVVKVMGIPDNYVVLPVYSQEVLSQIENATILGPWSESIVQNVAVGGGYIEHRPSFKTFLGYSKWKASDLTSAIEGKLKAMYAPMYGKKMLNMHHDGVTPAEVMVATRLSSVLDSTNPQLSFNVVGTEPNASLLIQMGTNCFGSETIAEAEIWYFVNSGNGKRDLNRTYVYTVLSSADNMMDTAVNQINGMNSRYRTICQISQFDWAPHVYPVSHNSNFNYGPFGILADADVYTMLDRVNLYNMHSAALLSEFSVPQMGAFSTKL